MKKGLLEFLKDKKEFIDISSFVKSNYDKEMLRHKPWVSVAESKKIKQAVSDLVSEGQIEVKNNLHLQLGKFFYLDGNPETKHHSIETLKIEAKIL